MDKKYKNRLGYSNPNKRMYQLSYFEVDEESSNNKVQKDYETKILKSLTNRNSNVMLKKINIAKYLKDETTKIKLIELFKNGFFNIAFNAKEKEYNTLLSNDEKAKSDFIFLDFDNTGKTSSQMGYASLHWIQCVLEKLDLNYIIKTSRNHTERYNRWHVFIPTLKTIQNDHEYKFYWNKIAQEFKNYSMILDENTKNINRNVFSSSSNTFKCYYRFNKNDLDYKLDKLELEVIKEKQNQISKANGASISLNKKSLDLYAKQVDNMYGMIVNKEKSYNSRIQMHRNAQDKTAQVFCKLDNPYVFFDNGARKESNSYNTFFSYQDYNNSVEVNNSVRENIQKNVEGSLRHEFFDKKDLQKRYLITNEGLGKSTTILNLAKNYKFIYATHTVDKLNEVDEELKKLNKKYKKSNQNEIDELIKLKHIIEYKQGILKNDLFYIDMLKIKINKHNGNYKDFLNGSRFLLSIFEKAMMIENVKMVESTVSNCILQDTKHKNIDEFLDSKLFIEQIFFTKFQKRYESLIKKYKSKIKKIDKKLMDLSYMYHRVRTNKEILKSIITDEEEYNMVYDDYIEVLNSKKLNKGYFISLADYLLDYSSRVNFDGSYNDRILKIIKQNNSLVNKDKVIIMTMAKLKSMLGMDLIKSTKTVVFDEFNKSDWYTFIENANNKRYRKKYKMSKEIRRILYKERIDFEYKPYYPELEYANILNVAMQKIKNNFAKKIKLPVELESDFLNILGAHRSVREYNGVGYGTVNFYTKNEIEILETLNNKDAIDYVEYLNILKAKVKSKRRKPLTEQERLALVNQYNNQYFTKKSTDIKKVKSIRANFKNFWQYNASQFKFKYEKLNIELLNIKEKVEKENKNFAKVVTRKLNWGGKTIPVDFYYQTNFIDLLEDHKVLILSTEKRLIDDILGAEDYKEFVEDKIDVYYDDNGNYIEEIDKDKMVLEGSLSDLANLKSRVYRFGDFEHKLLDEDITYALVDSTKKEHLLDMVKDFYRYFKNKNILDKDTVLISNGLKSSLSDNKKYASHTKVKGSNEYDEFSSLIFGTLQTEIVLLTHLINCPRYKDFKDEIEQKYNDSIKNKSRKKVKDRKKYFRDLIYNEIQDVFMECEISQSIGRNSGFRNRGRKKVVVLPLLNKNSSKIISKKINFNYISSNVLRFDYDKDLKKIKKL